jgi:hypothetical protein
MLYPSKRFPSAPYAKAPRNCGERALSPMQEHLQLCLSIIYKSNEEICRKEIPHILFFVFHP